jgi:hypothetical protein
MKVFVSHKKEDQYIAGAVAERLSRNGAEVYLDAIDPDAHKAGDDLADYLRAALSTCTDLMAVVSVKTKESWWVPWEIGVASEKDYPLSTFAGDSCELPLYMKKWPYLKTLADVDTYVRVSKAARSAVTNRYSYKTASQIQPLFVKQFYTNLRVALGQ